MDTKVVILIVGVLLTIVLLIGLSPLLFSDSTDNVDGNGGDSNGVAVRECESDSDCGSSGLTGVYECRDNSIFGESLTFVCLEANGNSNCLSFSDMEFIATCPLNEECIEGNRECVSIKTTTFTTTQGTFVTYSSIPVHQTKGSTTTLTDVTCVRDESCGLDHYGKPYCGGDGHSMRDYFNYTCSNPGTYSSRCKTRKTTYLFDYCGFDEVCIMGECLDEDYADWYCTSEDCCDTEPENCN